MFIQKHVIVTFKVQNKVPSRLHTLPWRSMGKNAYFCGLFNAIKYLLVSAHSLKWYIVLTMLSAICYHMTETWQYVENIWSYWNILENNLHSKKLHYIWLVYRLYQKMQKFAVYRKNKDWRWKEHSFFFFSSCIYDLKSTSHYIKSWLYDGYDGCTLKNIPMAFQ